VERLKIDNLRQELGKPKDVSALLLQGHGDAARDAFPAAQTGSAPGVSVAPLAGPVRQSGADK